MKRCPQCEAIKDLSAFNLDRTKKDGHYGICKECRQNADPTNRTRRVLLSFEPQPWAEHGACRGADPDLFFPERGQDTTRAKKVCTTCPVRQQCLSYALSHGERFGVWGGLSGRERRRLRRSQQDAVA